MTSMKEEISRMVGKIAQGALAPTAISQNNFCVMEKYVTNEVNK